MKHLFRKIACVLLAVSMIASLSGCSVLKELLAEETERVYAGDHKPEWGEGTDPTEETDPTTRETEEPGETEETEGTTRPEEPDDGKYIKTSKELTYPDHVASYDEVHPKHAPGNLKNEEAVARLNEVENTLLKSYISCYVDADILF